MTELIKLHMKRQDLAIKFAELGFKVGAELGVDMGHYSEVLCMVNPALKLYAIDSWKGEYKSHKKDAVKRLAPYNCEIIHKTSADAAKSFKPNSIDFVYIDADHTFEGVTRDLETWYKIVRKGGIISGHDYLTLKHPEVGIPVKMAIDKFVEKKKISKLYWVHRNYQSSWFFYK